MHTSGRLSLYTRGFDKQEPEQSIPVQTLVSPLGEWVTAATIESERINKEARAAQVLPPNEPVSPTIEELEPLSAFVDDPSSTNAYFRFVYEDSTAVGILTAQAT